MAVLPQFDPQAAPGQTQAVISNAGNTAQSWMDRAQLRRLREREQEMKDAQLEIMRPVQQAQVQAQIAELGNQTAGAKQASEMYATAQTEMPSFRQEFYDAMKDNDPSSRLQKTSGVIAKASKYASLKGIGEEVKSWQNIFAQDALNDRTRQAVLGRADVAKIRAQSEQWKRENAPPGSAIGKMLDDYNSALASGDQTAAQYILEGIKKESSPSGTQIEVGPDGQIIFRQGSGALTTAANTASQNAQYNNERLVKEGADLMRSLREEDVGIRGSVTENLTNKLLAQIDPSLAKEDVSESRTKLRAFRESALRAVSADSRFSNRDREAIEKLLPEDGLFESLPSAKAKLATIIGIFRSRASGEANRRGAKTFVDLTPEELVSEAQAGKMDQDVAAALLSALHPDWVKEQASKLKEK